MTNSVNISKACVIDPGVSDHSLVYVIRKFKRPKGEPKIIRVRSFKNFVDDDFLRDLRNSDWSYFLNFSDLDQSCDISTVLLKLWLINMLLLLLIKSKARLRHGSLMICCKPSKKGTILRKSQSN